MYCLKRLVSDDTTFAVWGNDKGVKEGPLYFDSLDLCNEFARNIAEQTQVEGPWIPTECKYGGPLHRMMVSKWGDGKRWWSYVGNGCYTMFELELKGTN